MTTRNIILIASGCCIIAGAVISGAAASRMMDKHTHEDKPVIREINEKVNTVTIDSKMGDISILPSDGDKITVEYVECESNRYDTDVNNGVLEIKSKDVLNAENRRRNWADRIFNIDFHRHSDYTVNVRIPKNILVDLNISADYGEVSAADGKFKAVECKMDFGGVELSGIQAERVTVASDLGDVELKNVQADINVECNYGEIRLDRIKGKNITIDNDCGDVKGTIAGKEQDYTINAETNMGDKNLQNRTGGQNRLDISVDLGDINIKFTD